MSIRRNNRGSVAVIVMAMMPWLVMMMLAAIDMMRLTDAKLHLQQSLDRAVIGSAAAQADALNQMANLNRQIWETGETLKNEFSIHSEESEGAGHNRLQAARAAISGFREAINMINYAGYQRACEIGRDILSRNLRFAQWIPMAGRTWVDEAGCHADWPLAELSDASDSDPAQHEWISFSYTEGSGGFVDPSAIKTSGEWLQRYVTKNHFPPTLFVARAAMIIPRPFSPWMPRDRSMHAMAAAQPVGGDLRLSAIETTHEYYPILVPASATVTGFGQLWRWEGVWREGDVDVPY